MSYSFLSFGSNPQKLMWQVAPEDPNKYHLRGVNIGSWMVLEPWITPSMFFQFLGKVGVFSWGGGEGGRGVPRKHVFGYHSMHSSLV